MSFLLGLSLLVSQNIEPTSITLPDQIAVVDQIPERFDWRDQFVFNEPRSQGKCGACVAFAASSVLEAQYAISCQAHLQLSPQHVMACVPGDCKAGLLTSQAVAYIGDFGIPAEDCFPYQEKNTDCANTCADWRRSALKAESFKITSGFIDIEAIKNALLRGPLLSSLILYSDFETYKGGIYQHQKGNQLGSHAVVIVGYDTSERYWIIKNSYGPSWGEGGYGKISWDDKKVLLGRYTWLFKVKCT